MRLACHENSRRRRARARAWAALAAVLAAAPWSPAIAAGARAAATADGVPPSELACPLVRGGTRVVCRLPEDTCDGGLVTMYASCVADTANDASPGRLADVGMPSVVGGYRALRRPCFDEIPVYRCSCTPLGDYCAPGSACKRTAVLAGTVIPAGGYQQLIGCRPTPRPELDSAVRTAVEP